MKRDIIPILIHAPGETFIDHLSLDGNERIIFSGRFGLGKTTFLKQFFQEKNQEEIWDKVKYNVVHLSPVNYSVASNEDIFRYIKHDIIFELNKLTEFEEKDFEYLKTLPKFLRSNLHKVVAPIILTLPKLGKDLFPVYKYFEDIQERFFKFHDEHSSNEKAKLEAYLNNIHKNEGNIYEEDIITKLIENILSRLSTNNTIENILILDDLDRIDPQHIFRLFNIFAAHLDLTDEKRKNKFGFDKVILVCDITNIRNIFKNNYGADVDFNGYIDKFYSKEIFYFDNRETVSALTSKILSSIKVKTEPGSEASHLDFYINRKTTSDRDVRFIIENMILCNAISLRTLLRHVGSVIHLKPKAVNLLNGKEEIENWQLDAVLKLDFIKSLLGDHEQLLTVFQKCQNTRNNEESAERTLETTIILDYYNNMLECDDSERVFNNKHISQSVTYKLHKNQEGGLTAKLIEAKKDKTVSNGYLYFLNLSKVVELLQSIGYYH